MPALEKGIKNTTAIHKLTALWALCESGLGGWMHALKLPFTGFTLGAFSIVIIALIAWNTGNSFRKIMQATLVVVLIKAAVSPQSSPAAYLAVGFQGLMGAVFFSLLPFRLAAVLTGVITMLESALQMVIIKTLIFGMALWEAIDLLFAKAARLFYIDSSVSFSLWIIGAYLLLYATWGLVLGIWIGKLPRAIAQRKNDVLQKADEARPINNEQVPVAKKRSRYRKLLSIFLILLFIIAVYMVGQYDDAYNKTVYIIFRTLAIIILFYWVVNPFIRWLMQRWVAKQDKNSDFYSVMNQMTETRSFIRPAYALAREYKGWKRYKEFILSLLVMTLYAGATDK